MKYYWIASTIDIKTAKLPCREIKIKNCHFFPILSHFGPFLKVILLIIFSYFIDHFYNIFRSSKSGPW